MYGLYHQAVFNNFYIGLTVFSIVAQLLLMGRRIESWPFWLLVNSISVPLYLSRGLQLTALLYAAYWFNALASWWFWHRQMQSQQQLA